MITFKTWSSHEMTEILLMTVVGRDWSENNFGTTSIGVRNVLGEAS